MFEGAIDFRANGSGSFEFTKEDVVRVIESVFTDEMDIALQCPDAFCFDGDGWVFG